jgi:hypothetical protein
VPYAPPLFKSFFLAGFECSTHRRRDGTRLDMVAASRHDTFAAADYARCTALDIHTVRDGVRWHLGERSPGMVCVKHEAARVRAARDAGVQVVWDLWHYGQPADVELLDASFPRRLARWARAFADMVASECADVPLYCPVNEISFVAWGGGDVAYLEPFRRAKGAHLKRQLVRAAIEASDAVRLVDARARLCHIDPVIHIAPHAERPHDAEIAEGCRQGMFEAWDLLSGAQEPWLGGAPEYLDVIGINFYSRNQWVHDGPPILLGDPLYRALDAILAEVYARYRRPLFVAETGIEFEGRAAWLAEVGEAVRRAMAAGVPVEGLCWYPILNHPGWDDDRHLQCGLWDYADSSGHRPVHAPLLDELRRQQRLFMAAREGAGAPPFAGTLAPA